MIKKIRRQFEDVREKRHHVFEDFDPIIQRIFREYSHLFPSRRINKDGSKYVYHPNVEGVDPISLEKQHGSREFIPPRYAKFAIRGIDDLLSYIETHPDAACGRAKEEVGLDQTAGNEQKEVSNAGNENSNLLPESKIPDRDS